MKFSLLQLEMKSVWIICGKTWYMKDHVFMQPMPGYLTELRGRITHAFAIIEREMLG